MIVVLCFGRIAFQCLEFHGFTCLPDVCLRADRTAGSHGRIIFRCVRVFIFVSHTIFTAGRIGWMILRWVCICLPRVAFAGCLGQIILQWVCLPFARGVSSLMPWWHDSAICVLCALSFSLTDLSNGVFLLDDLAVSFCIMCF